MLAIEFGSGRRGDADLSSDRDLLLIASSWDELKPVIALKSAAGYSVSSFLFGKAEYLTKRGSLFFKHICDEGALVSGPKQAYDNLVFSWQAADDYRDEVDENVDLLELVGYLPGSSEGCVALIDILISSVRNILIRRLACQGEYVFSWRDVFAAAHTRDIIKAEDIQCFLVARQIKNLYRQGHICKVSNAFLDALLTASGRACGVTLRSRVATRAILRSLPDRYADRTYKQLRAAELMCAEYGFDDALDPLMSLVRRPAYFCANGA